jgi:hypothetical protein
MAYNLLIEEYPLSEKYIAKKGDKYIFDGFVCDFSGVGRFALGMMDQIEVIKPKSFKEFLNEKIKRKTF